MPIVGLDAASDPQKFGYALGVVRAGVVEIQRAGLLESAEVSDAIGDVIAPELERADRALSGKKIPLTWEPGFTGIGVVEVYPAATLQALEPRLKKHKGKERDREKWLPVRYEIARKLKVPLPELEEFVDGSADIFDACVCLMAGIDFLEGRALPPMNHTTAEREGWIWVRAPIARTK